MRIWRTWTRLTLAMVVVSGILLTAATDTAPIARAGPLAGDWSWTIQGACKAVRRNPHACDEMLSMGLHVYDLKTTSLTYRGQDRLTVDARGQYIENGSATFSGKSPDGARLHLCNPTLMERALFRKTCRVTWHGDGHLEKGGTFLTDFFTGAGRLTYRNRSITYYEDYKSVGDSLIPAVPGTYDTKRYLSLVGYANFIPGVTIRITVAQYTSRR